MEEKFRTRWNVLALGALDEKHIALKKPKESGSDYYNYKGLFSLVLLALVDTEYRFLWINCGSRRSLLDARVFNRNDLREKTEDGSLGFLASEPLWERRPELCYFSCLKTHLPCCHCWSSVLCGAVQCFFFRYFFIHFIRSQIHSFIYPCMFGVKCSV